LRLSSGSALSHLSAAQSNRVLRNSGATAGVCRGLHDKKYCCYSVEQSYSRLMRLGSLVKSLAVLPVVLLIGSGCGGIAASGAVSPLMFLLPGLGQNKAQTPPVAVPAVTAPSLVSSEPIQVLAKAN